MRQTSPERCAPVYPLHRICPTELLAGELEREESSKRKKKKKKEEEKKRRKKTAEIISLFYSRVTNVF